MHSIPIKFDSWRSYFSFSLAREFYDRNKNEIWSRSPEKIEQISDFFAKILLKPLDFVMKEFRNPMMIVAWTIVLLICTTIIFYPVELMAIASRVLPFIKYIHAEHLKFALFATLQTVITAIGLRSLYRLSDPLLAKVWHEGRIVPVPLGAVYLMGTTSLCK